MSMECIIKYDQRTWSVILVGLIKEWVTLSAVNKYAEDLILAGDDSVYLVNLLDCTSVLDAIDTIKENIEHNVDDILDTSSQEMKIWRFCKLKMIVESSYSDDNKLLKIQEIYGEFGFPEDMAICSPYYIPDNKGQNKNAIEDSPLKAAEKLVETMERELI